MKSEGTRAPFLRLARHLTIGVGVLIALAIGYSHWRGRGASTKGEPPRKKAPTFARWSDEYLRSNPHRATRTAPRLVPLKPETRAAILALYPARTIKAAERIRRLLEITGDDAFPYLSPLILDPTIPDEQGRIILMDMLIASKCGGMRAFCENVSDGVYDDLGEKANDPRFRDVFLTIATDHRFDSWIRDAALVGLNQIGFDEAGRAAVLNSIDLREMPTLLVNALSIAGIHSGESSAEQRDELVGRALTIASIAKDPGPKEEAVRLLAKLKIDVGEYDFLQGYETEASVGVRREKLRGFAQSAASDPLAFERLLGVYCVETDQGVREEALTALATNECVRGDPRALRWAFEQVGPPTSPNTAVLVLSTISEAGSADASTRAIVLSYLRSIADDEKCGADLRREAQILLAELEAGR